MTDVLEDVVVFLVNTDARELASVGRDSKEVAAEFCRRPKWPFKLSEHFVAVDEWGFNTGSIVAATPSFSNWIGKTFADFQRESGYKR